MFFQVSVYFMSFLHLNVKSDWNYIKLVLIHPSLERDGEVETVKNTPNLLGS